MTSSDEHSSAARTLVDDEPARTDDRPSVEGRLQRLCRAAHRDLPASGVGVSILSKAGDLLTAAASSDASLRIEELQFALGEGPCLAAMAAQEPVLVPDLMAATTWPGYGPAAHSRGVRAVFAFPLQVGAARLGALDVYRDEAGELSPWATSRARGFADEALQTMLKAQQAGEMGSWLADESDTRFEVYQAQGMVMVQLGVAPDEALARIRAFAFAHDRRLADVAEDVIARRLVLEPDEPA